MVSVRVRVRVGELFIFVIFPLVFSNNENNDGKLIWVYWINPDKPV